MAQVVITFRIMPDSPDVDLTKLEKKAREAVTKFGGEVGKVETKPFAFGLMAMEIFFVMDEAKGSTETLEQEISDYEEVNSVEVVDVRRTIG
jgi:elongation factor 1-beta